MAGMQMAHMEGNRQCLQYNNPTYREFTLKIHNPKYRYTYSKLCNAALYYNSKY
jgi:hypothetical protein